MHLFQTSVPCSCSRQSIFIPDLFHVSVQDFRSMQLFQTKYFRFRSVPCICSRLPFHAAVPDKVFPFQTSVPCSCSRQSISIPALFHASFSRLSFHAAVPCICSRLLFHAVVPDKVFPFQLCSVHLFQTSVPCICSRLPFHAVSIPSIPFCVLFRVLVIGAQPHQQISNINIYLQ